MSGGLGPTDGDLTRAALARVTGEALVEDAVARSDLEARLTAHDRPITPLQLRQAQRPVSARCLPNPRGTAPGLHAAIPVAAAHRSADIYCLPGPPGELRPMFEHDVLPSLRPDPAHLVITRLLHIVGIPESEAAQRIQSLTARTSNPLVGITASGAVLTIRIRFQGAAAPQEAIAAIDSVEQHVRDQLGSNVFGVDDDTITAVVLKLLKEQHGTIATVESCTGGLLGAMLSETPGSSAAFIGGWVTYSNQLKITEVDIPESLVTQHGAVSHAVASAMAQGGLARSRASHCLAITGIAGPDGGTPDKPVGMVYIALATRTSSAAATAEARVDVRRFLFPGDREDIRTRAARTALTMLYFSLAHHAAKPAAPQPVTRLLWQQPDNS
jgi:nicotinamide-nucleotide amidase